jgi:hypothetical protein
VSFSIIDQAESELGISRLAEAIKEKKAELARAANGNGAANGH